MMNLKDIPKIIKEFINNNSQSDDDIVAAVIMIVVGILGAIGISTFLFL